MSGIGKAGLAILLGLVIFKAYTLGGAINEGKHQAQENTRLQDEANRKEAEIRRGEKASGALQAELLAQSISSDQLNKAFNDYKKRNPILARKAVAPAAQASSGTSGATVEIQCQQSPDGPEPGISLGGIWMWNSALAGRDIPAGACGLDDPTSEACAADSGITLEDAWDNQAANARSCAVDRLRYQRLIDFIKGHPQ